VTIFGNVTDASGSVVAGAAITATNAHTSLERVTTSDDNGNSAISQMPVGVYAVKAVFPGFKTFRLDGIQTQVDENRRVNIVMELGALSESVTVAGQTAQVDTRSETLRDVIDSQRRGDFSASATPLRDPRGGVFPNNVIPTNRLHPASQRFLEAFVPLPNRPGALLTFASQETLKDDQAIVKVDHHLSQANQLSGRLLYNFNDRAEATANLPGFFAAIEYSNRSLGAQSDLDQPAVLLKLTINHPPGAIDTPYQTTGNPFPFVPPQTPQERSTYRFLTPMAITEFRNAIVQQWNVNVQQQPFGSSIVTIAYVGSRGDHLFMTKS
jgi:hypothetical protein